MKNRVITGSEMACSMVPALSSSMGGYPPAIVRNLLLPVEDASSHEIGQPGHCRVQAAVIVVVILVERNGLDSHSVPMARIIASVADQCETPLTVISVAATVSGRSLSCRCGCNPRTTPCSWRRGRSKSGVPIRLIRSDMRVQSPGP